MKRILTCILTVSLASSLAACGSAKTSSTAESTASSKPSSFTKDKGQKTETDDGEYLEGNYIYEEGSSQWIVRVRTEGGLIMIENSMVDGLEIYMQYVQEIWPHGQFRDDGYTASVTGIDMPYDIEDGVAEYWNLASDSTVTKTDDGINLRNESEGDASSISFAKTDEMIHTEDTALRDELAASQELNADPDMVGEWKYFGENTQAWLCLKDSGTMEYLVKDKGEPAEYYSGGWTADDGNLYILCERMGTGKERYSNTLQINAEDGVLNLSDEAKTGILPDDTDCAFYEADPAWTLQEDLMFDSSIAIKESYTQEGTAELAEGDIECSYHIPYLTDGDIGSDDAAAINKELEDFEAAAEAQVQMIINETMPEYTAIGWYAHIYDNVMSLVIYQKNTLDKMVYTVYCYDLANGVKVSREDMLYKAGVSEEAMLTAAGEASEAYFIRTNAGLSEQQKKDSGYEEMLAMTKSSDYINPNIQILLDGTGELIAIVPVPSLAGDSYYYHELYLSFRTVSTEGYDPETDALTDAEAINILEQQGLIQDYEDQGMVLMGTGQTIEVNGELCTVVAVGTDHEDQFVSEYQYAVSRSYMVYYYDPVADAWLDLYS